jgi:hypothetical protein
MLLPADAADLSLKRVMLSSGGVGYFEYEAIVDGDTTLTLDVALDQVDDVLKSLVVYDETGTAGEITLPGRNPLAQSFADLPFDRSALNSATDLLNALQGAEIRIAGAKPLTGRLVHVDPETVQGPAGTLETRQRVTLLTSSGLQQATLAEADGIAFTDAELQKQVDAALTRVATYHDNAHRRLTLRTRGNGQRKVRVGYVIASPLWKTSYRLSLPGESQAEKARLQGWAVVENFSGQAWQDVELTLLSGSPVAFRQALYESYYVPRPSVPIESGGRILPSADTGTVGAAALAKAAAAPQEYAPPPPPAPAPTIRPNMAARSAKPEQLAPETPAAIEAAQAAEGATQIAFTLPYRVNAPVGQSVVLPVLDREVPAKRVDLYQPSTDRQHPLAAVELTNNGDTGLPPGVLTLYQQGAQGAAYLGDARLGAFPTGDKRLLSFALDQKVAVDRDTSERRFITKAAITEGVMRLTRMSRQTTTYRMKASTPPPSFVIEHPRSAGWTLNAPDPKTIDITASAYRIPADLAGKSEGSVVVVEDRPIEETIALSDLADNRLDVLAQSNELDPPLRRALADLAGRRQAIARQRAELERMKEKRALLVEDETRLRDDLTAVGREPGLRKRLLDKFAETETAIDAISASIAKGTETLAAAERDLGTYVAGLKL